MRLPVRDDPWHGRRRAAKPRPPWHGPNASSFRTPIARSIPPDTAGTREYLACEAGQLALATGGEVFDLSPGDVVVFQGDQRHSYRNPGRVPAVGYSVVLLAGPTL
jgi:mannose-6-phosphate isomerase-like protein (cupin superfamily)